MSFSFCGVNLKGIEGLLSGVLRCCEYRQYSMTIDEVGAVRVELTMARAALRRAALDVNERICDFEHGRNLLSAN